jgi:hypothetical protein
LLRGEPLLEWLARIPPADRDRRIEQRLGIGDYPLEAVSLGDESIGYLSSGISAIVRATFEIPVTRDDVFVDLGAGLGKVGMVVHLLTGARTRGIEVQPSLVAHARARADALGLEDVTFTAEDARLSDLDEGTVFFLYLPFTGATLAAVLSGLSRVARTRPIVVCTLGLDLRGVDDWLTPRQTDAYWISIYDSRAGLASGHPRRHAIPLSAAAEAIALERPWPAG